MSTVLEIPVGHVSPVKERSLIARVFLGKADEPRWARPVLWAVLLLAGGLYGWNLAASGDANTYYAAAVYSGAQSWKAWFFGALDAGAFITVDKPPFALWVMGLSARIFGYSSWSMLLPQALMGVAAVGILYSSVRRGLVGRLGAARAAAGASVAALVFALTPITVAINRDNNPDTLLVLLLVGAAWCCQRAIANGKLLPLLGCAALVGCAFNTKMLQGYVPLPAFALAYLALADVTLGRRIKNLLLAGVALVAASGWWMGVVALFPADARPYIGGSTDNTVWDLVIGYNGLGRIFGADGPGSTGGGGGSMGGGGGASFGGASGAGRLFNETMAGQISWLLPAAALLTLAALVLVGRARRTDPARALLVLWGGWLLLHYAVFSFAEGTFHPYYTTAMAPAVAALAGACGALLWRAPRALGWVLPVTAALTGIWAFEVLRRTPDWHPWLAWTVAAASFAAVLTLLIVAYGPRAGRTLTALALTAALVTGLAGPAAYAASAATTPVNGTNPTAGPASSSGPGGMGRPGSGSFPDGGGNGFPGGGQPPSGMPDAQPPSSTSQPQDTQPQDSQGQGSWGQGAPGGGGGPGGGFGGRGGLDEETVAYLKENQGEATWLVAVSDAQTAASLILSTGEPVISMGGFTGSDRAMTVERLKELVADGKLKYIVVGGSRGGAGEVDSWVQENATPVEEVGDGSLYELSAD
ncbi:ArnT family glycosyltransferase [Actinocorallia sp. A-T 12471]|uniref:ArnT family glycosyltransferase n=1 Tax=Actinocorallia sp. A-T 12471 TaxID=3089813 RepID=UPI0029D2BA6B|nr:glycosyltransferase family 39 protein [Actinocorallia sp. A-T 12471]MDX6743005.1 glycosyltransferase family 39 protein [Actinocorallia sp. A-T 12471]